MIDPNSYEQEVWLDVRNNPKFEINMLVAITWPSGTYVGQIVGGPWWNTLVLDHVYDVQCRCKLRQKVFQQDMERYHPPIHEQRKLLKHWSRVCS